ncbi:MAG: antiterminator LoaP [Xylanivirga thermophila]|jgi:transcription termination/antitermination protein NusG|uniref:antiterminator LoaP n=1 Tax=Xylanivirga thermophila TaxID=2496273 RepID=UPI0039F5C6E4
MYCYVLFTCTGREEKVKKILEKRLDNKVFMPFIPMSEAIFRRSGQTKKELRPIFPSYVFIESELSSIEVIQKTRHIIYASKDIISFLQYDDTGDIAMKDHERNMLLRLCNDDRCIESSSGIIVGTRVYINEGPLIGLESIIKKTNRHKRRAIIELEFMGEIRQVSVPLEILKKA